MEEILKQLGYGVTANFIYDTVKTLFKDKSFLDRGDLQKGLVSHLSVENADIAADKIIEFLASNGDLKIIGSRIYAGESIQIMTSNGTRLVMRSSTSETPRTRIDATTGQIEAQGGAGVKQDLGNDGSIRFYT